MAANAMWRGVADLLIRKSFTPGQPGAALSICSDLVGPNRSQTELRPRGRTWFRAGHYTRQFGVWLNTNDDDDLHDDNNVRPGELAGWTIDPHTCNSLFAGIKSCAGRSPGFASIRTSGQRRPPPPTSLQDFPLFCRVLLVVHRLYLSVAQGRHCCRRPREYVSRAFRASHHRVHAGDLAIWCRPDRRGAQGVPDRYVHHC